MWFFLVAQIILTVAGEKTLIRAIGPFDEAIVCETARNGYEARWKGEKCFEAFEEVSSDEPVAPPWFGFGI
jgi:hypothetical protein